jgi:hypothetical protein
VVDAGGCFFWRCFGSCINSVASTRDSVGQYATDISTEKRACIDWSGHLPGGSNSSLSISRSRSYLLFCRRLSQGAVKSLKYMGSWVCTPPPKKCNSLPHVNLLDD